MQQQQQLQQQQQQVNVSSNPNAFCQISDPRQIAEASAAISQLEACSRQLQQQPILSGLAQVLQQHVDSAKEAMSASKPLDVRIRTTSAYLSRKLSRIQQLDASILSLQEERASATKDAAIARQRLRDLQSQQLQQTTAIQVPSPQVLHAKLVSELQQLQDPRVQEIFARFSPIAEDTRFSLEDDVVQSHASMPHPLQQFS